MKDHKISVGWDKVPDGMYYLEHKVRGFGAVKATMKVEDGSFIVLKGSTCAPIKSTDHWAPDVAKSAVIVNNILQEDVYCPSPSTAGWVALGKSNNGWTEWRNENGDALDIYRHGKSK